MMSRPPRGGRRVAVLAGNRRQFDDEMRRRGLPPDNPEYRYIDGLRRVLGAHFTAIEQVGTYWENPAYGERGFTETLKSRLVPGPLPHCGDPSCRLRCRRPEDCIPH